jgi:anti-anti-sigma factor
VIGTGERKSCQGDDLGLVDDRRSDVGQRLEVGASTDSIRLGEGGDRGERKHKQGVENSHGGTWLGQLNGIDSTEVCRLVCDIHTGVIFDRFRFPTLPSMRDEPLTYSFTEGKSDGTRVLKLVGPLTISTMFGFQDAFRAATPRVMILDMSETTYMDSAGLGLIMNYYVSAQDHGRKLLLCGVNERVRALLEMTRVQGVLACFPSTEAAEASL